MKIGQTTPIGTPASEPYTRCVSIDGDADRIVYFFTDENNQFFLLDGDRIATLYAGYAVYYTYYDTHDIDIFTHRNYVLLRFAAT